ncbi:hypothetical protein PR003_g4681 [Phytophthora rubi]|uniref:Cytochrome P450 n=1 Tax=Phytophthora rubi TaxID=129364 RepID=A0A6A4FLP6_9STRA|nr:hypothetical protein PR001_g11015 [Phytophthora rubi]KAE9032159.1 hypothetical protein PR002_g9333 [Phytophthora rubi]KAE9351882.1 hypothetical protein PR003_g4681 [Phytophthora rubi]
MQMMKDVMEATGREKLDVFLDVLDTYHNRGQPFSAKQELSHFTMDVIAKIAFSIELDTLKDSPDREDDHEFLKAFNKACVAFGVRIQSPLWLWRLKRYLNAGWEKVFRENNTIIQNFVNDVIVQSMNKKAEFAARGEKVVARDLITLFMESNLRHSEDIHIEDDDATIMRDMVMSFAFAGKDSTVEAQNPTIGNLRSRKCSPKAETTFPQQIRWVLKLTETTNRSKGRTKYSRPKLRSYPK